MWQRSTVKNRGGEAALIFAERVSTSCLLLVLIFRSDVSIRSGSGLPRAGKERKSRCRLGHGAGEEADVFEWDYCRFAWYQRERGCTDCAQPARRKHAHELYVVWRLPGRALLIARLFNHSTTSQDHYWEGHAFREPCWRPWTSAQDSPHQRWVERVEV